MKISAHESLFFMHHDFVQREWGDASKFQRGSCVKRIATK